MTDNSSPGVVILDNRRDQEIPLNCQVMFPIPYKPSLPTKEERDAYRQRFLGSKNRGQE